MKIIYHYCKACLVVFLYITMQTTSEAQSFMAASASTAKIAQLSLGEGIAQKDQLLLDLVTKAGLMPVLTNDEAHTLFIPSQQVLLQHINDTPEQLKAFLEQHIVKGNLSSADLKDGADLKALNGENLRICRKKNSLIISGVRLKQTDQVFANGVAHHLNGSFQVNTSTF